MLIKKCSSESPVRRGLILPLGTAAMALLVPLLGLAHLGQEEIRNCSGLALFY